MKLAIGRQESSGQFHSSQFPNQKPHSLPHLVPQPTAPVGSISLSSPANSTSQFHGSQFPSQQHQSLPYLVPQPKAPLSSIALSSSANSASQFHSCSSSVYSTSQFHSSSSSANSAVGMSLHVADNKHSYCSAHQLLQPTTRTAKLCSPLIATPVEHNRNLPYSNECLTFRIICL